MINIGELLMFSAPVAIAAAGEAVHQLSGSINIGLEGMMLGGAYSAMAVTLATGNPWIGLAAGVAVGLALSALQSVFTLKLARDQVVVGTALNLLALGVTGTLFRIRFGESGQLLSVPTLPKFAGTDGAVVLSVVVALFLAWAIRKSGWGLALRAAGEYPQAVEATGFSVLRLRLGASLIGGAMAGLAGAYLCVGVAGSFAENMTQGRGFVAIAMVTFGRWNVVWVFLASLLVGYAESLQFGMQSGGSKVPFQFFLALPYLLALFVLFVAGRGGRAPAALAQPYTPPK